MADWRKTWKTATAFTLLAALIALLVLPFILRFGVTSENKMAASIEQSLNEKLVLLDQQMEKAINGDKNAWLDVTGVPEDMIIYRYVSDTLQSWVNQFTVLNDDIRTRTMIPNLSNLRDNASLSTIGSEPEFVNYGPKWYLVKSISDPQN